MTPDETGITVDDPMDGPRLVLYPDGTPVPGLDDGIGQTYAALLWWKDGTGRRHLELFRDWPSAWAGRDRRNAEGHQDVSLGKFVSCRRLNTTACHPQGGFGGH